MQREVTRSLNLDIFDDQNLWQQVNVLLNEELPLWTDDDIMCIYDCLLEDALRNLFSKNCSLATTTEIYNWITATDDKEAFSFNNCCLVSGLDPDVIRIAVLYEFEATRIHNLH